MKTLRGDWPWACDIVRKKCDIVTLECDILLSPLHFVKWPVLVASPISVAEISFLFILRVHIPTFFFYLQFTSADTGDIINVVDFHLQ